MPEATTLTQPVVVVELPKEVTKYVQSSGLEIQTADQLLAAYRPFFVEIDRLLEDAKRVEVTDATQVAMINHARDLRLDLRKVRVAADKARIAMKEDSKRRSDAIDGVYRLLRFKVEPIEERLLAAEEFAERAEAKRNEDRRQKRVEALKPYPVDAQFYDLINMPDKAFDELLAGIRGAHEKAEADKLKAEQDRLAKEKADADERERVRLENERLKKEADEKEAALKVERERVAKEKAEAEAQARKEREAAEAKFAEERRVAEEKAAVERKRVEAEKKAAEEKARKEREEIEAKAKAERDAAAKKAAAERAAREKVEAELKAHREAEEKRKAAEAEAARKAVAAPDRDKLFTYANAIRTMDIPTLSTPAATAIATTVRASRDKFVGWIEEKAGAL